MTLMELKNLEKVYKNDAIETPALRGVSFSVEAGEFTAVMGPSGSGKSTLMHIMCFLDRPTKGSYKFEGNSIEELSDNELAVIRNKRMGFIFQTFNLLARTTVFDNVMLPLIYGDSEEKQEKEKVEQAIEEVQLSHRSNFYPNQLSGGEKQRVAIARALVNNPSVVFADEPTGNLDSKSGNIIMNLLQELNDKGHTVVLVTHEKYTSQHAKRIIYLQDGEVTSDGKVNKRKYAKYEKVLTK